MPRLVDIAPFSNEELPGVDERSRRGQRHHTTHKMTTDLTRPQQLVPKSTVKPSSRKVRHLDSGSEKSKGSLFQRCHTPNDTDSPRTRNITRQSPTKRIRAWREADIEVGAADNSSFPFESSLSNTATTPPTPASSISSLHKSSYAPSSTGREKTQIPPHADEEFDTTHGNGDDDSTCSFKSAFVVGDDIVEDARTASQQPQNLDFQANKEQPRHGTSGPLTPPTADDISSPTNEKETRSNAHTADVGAAHFIKSFAQLRLEVKEVEQVEEERLENSTLTRTPTKPVLPRKLASPKKQAAIPKTPHRPSTDAFWSQEVVDDWNEQYSPRKLFIALPAKSPKKGPDEKSFKKTFNATKDSLAADFLKELDAKITHGQIEKLAESTGGVKIVWSKTLQTTAGRASWKRETITTKKADGSVTSVTHKHHTSIQLAEKVIDDELRLLNVVAHEFCHLANYMVSGIVTNPHGKEFKAWAAKCSREFGDRGIEVTTKHSYDIDFKYVWQCTDCAVEYKRHSKSISPDRHRCAKCSGTLKQTKPTPRAQSKPSDYQVFFREQMKVVKREHPGRPQKEIMGIISGKWAKRSRSNVDVETDVGEDLLQGMQELKLAGLSIDAPVYV